MQSALLDAALKLPPEERSELIDRLTDSLADEQYAPPLSAEQKAELQRRFDRIEREGSTGEDWRVAMQRLLARNTP